MGQTMLKLLKSFLALYQVPTHDKELVQAQLREMVRRTPMVYFITLLSALGLAHTMYGVAPMALVLPVPAFLVAVCAYRIVYWSMQKGRTYTHDQAVARLSASGRLAGIMSILFAAWCIAVASYGDVATQGLVAFYITVPAVGVVSCVMYLRAAAMYTGTGVVLPFSLYYISTGVPNNVVMGCVSMTVTLAVIYVMLTYYDDFAKLISSNSVTKSLSEENKKLANIDSLTELPNRRKFFDDLDGAFKCLVDRERMTVGIIDLDGFKPINDVYGHDTGDRLLAAVAKRLEPFERSSVKIARLGGDEFALIAYPALSDDDASELGADICMALTEPFILEEGPVHIGGSMGIVTSSSREVKTAHKLYEQADHALYFAKNNCRGQAILYSQSHAEEILRRSYIETSLKNANLDEELRMKYQPIFNQFTGEIVAIEALARWITPDGTVIPPSVFIEQAERSGMMNHLTTVLLAKALKAAETWPDHVELSFNLSAADIGNVSTVRQIMDAVENSSFPAERMVFEITETSILRDFERAIDSLNKFKEMGAKIALDDFGTGFSSLSYLQRLPLDRLKLDRSFVSDIASNKKTKSIVASIVQLGRDIETSVVAEGVETREQQEILAQMNCALLQGFSLARPMEEVAVHELLEVRHPLEAATSTQH